MMIRKSQDYLCVVDKMQTFEALISLFLLVSIIPLFFLDNENYIDDSLYRAQLTEDAWRVLYLRGNFQDFGPSKHADVENDITILGEQTDLCLFLDGVWITNCRGGSASHAITASLDKTVVYDKILKNVTFSIGN
jgi:hypothetical protein